MNEYLEIIKNLSSRLTEKNEVCLTLYLPYNKGLRSDYETHIKSNIIASLRNDIKTKPFHHAHQKIAEIIVKKSKKVKDFKEGLAVFLKISPERVDKGHQEINPDEVIIESLSLKPQEEGVINKYFDLDQLIWEAQNLIEAIIVHITSVPRN